MANEILHKVLEYQKATFENLYNSVEAVQNEAQRLTEQSLGKAEFLPEGAREVVGKWFQANKEVRENVRNVVSKGHEQIAHYLGAA